MSYPFFMNSECMNNVLKMKTLRKLLKVPQLIEVFIRIFIMQEKLIKMALQGQGKFSLKPRMRFLKCNYDTWIRMTEDEREARFQKFFKGPKTTPDTIVSADGETVMPNVSRVAKKKGSRKPNYNKTVSLQDFVLFYFIFSI